MSKMIVTKEKAVEAYPDGWTCVSCGTEFSYKTINVECFYAIVTDEGTECIECANIKI